MNSPITTASWYRVCWTLRSNGRTVESGILTGRDVLHMLASLRDCVPIAPQDPEAVRAAVDTPQGWSFESDTVSVHTHPTPVTPPWLPLLGCPVRQGWRLVMSHRGRRKRLESVTFAAALMTAWAVTVIAALTTISYP